MKYWIDRDKDFSVYVDDLPIPMICDICNVEFHVMYVCRDYLKRCPCCYDEYVKNEEDEMYHAKDGLYFVRQDDGSVRVIANKKEITRWILSPDTWASVVASVCAKGEDGDTFRKAEIFHEGG